MCPFIFGEDLGDCLCIEKQFGAYKFDQNINQTAEFSNNTASLNLVGRTPFKLSDFKMHIQMGDSSHSDLTNQTSHPIINI